MKINSSRFENKPNRLKCFDYSNVGYYFLTLCTYKHQLLFGSIENSKIILNNCGKIVKKNLIKIKEIYEYIEVDYKVIMPNHIHLILIVGDANFASPTQSNNRTKMTISKVIQQFKRQCTIDIRDHLNERI